MNDTVNIANCPHCSGAHIYKLEVERACIMKMMTSADAYEQPRKVKITRIFICPIKNEQYQGTFYLCDTSSDRIENVSVIGLGIVTK